MQLTLESALSQEALLGHLSYVLLVGSMLSQRMAVLRVLVIASALVAILYNTLILRDPVGSMWETALVLVNVVQLYRLRRADRRASFSAEDRLLIDGRLPPLSPGLARRFLDTGDWRDLPAGALLTVEGTRPEALSFLAAGSAEILSGARRLAVAEPGAFIGEMALLDPAATASATARMLTPGRVWQVPYDKVARMEQAQPEAYAALGAAITRDLRDKILRQNEAGA